MDAAVMILLKNTCYTEKDFDEVVINKLMDVLEEYEIHFPLREFKFPTIS
jgi:hypothetical protein